MKRGDPQHWASVHHTMSILQGTCPIVKGKKGKRFVQFDDAQMIPCHFPKNPPPASGPTAEPSGNRKNRWPGIAEAKKSGFPLTIPFPRVKINKHAGVVELVDSVDLGAVTLGKVFRFRRS